MEKVVESRVMNGKEKKNTLNSAKTILSVFAYIMVVTYVYLIIRRWILITDASLEAYGSGGFINRSILLSNKDILANFTIAFDSLQVVALIGILVALILLIVNISNKNRKILIGLSVIFTAMVILRLIRIILIHLNPDDFIFIGFVDNLGFAYFDFAFFIYSTDILRMVITVLLIISTILFILYEQKTRKTSNTSFVAPIILGVVLLFYTATVIYGGSIEFDTDREGATLYYIHYIAQTCLQIGNIMSYLCIGRKGKLFSS